MKKKLQLLVLTFIVGFSMNLQADRGDFISATKIDSMTTDEIYDLYADLGINIFIGVIPNDYDVDFYKVVYETIDVFEVPVNASGLVAVPIGVEDDLSILQYNHGTTRNTNQSDMEGGEWFISLAVATGGNYVGIMPDYLGYGESACTAIHGYNVNKPLGRDGADMIRAVRTFCEQETIGLDGDIFVTGYSEGGYAAMAVAKEAQENLPDLDITAAAPLSGAYQVYPLTRDFIIDPVSENSGNLSYIIYSYNNIYNIIGDLSEAIIAPYDTIIPIMWNECNPGPSNLPQYAYEMVDSVYLNNILNDPSHPVNVALKENNIYDWVPDMPMRLYYCTMDEQVPFMNAILTADTMNLIGAQCVEAINMGDSDHNGCAPFALLNSKAWFDDIRELDDRWEICEEDVVVDTTGTGGTDSTDVGLNDVINLKEAYTVYPNPAEDVVVFESNIFNGNVYQLELFDLNGRLLVHQIATSEKVRFNVSSFESGIYILRVRDGENVYNQKFVVN